MYLGDGEYLIVSMCLRTPYDFKKIDSLMKEIFFNHKIDRIEATYFDILPQEVNYYKIWGGEFKECDLKLFSINMLEDKFLSLLDLEFDNKIVARLQIEFLDDTWYEISMIFNFTKLIDEEKSIELKKYNAKFVEDISVIMFKSVKPLLGKICVESSFSSIKAIINKEEFLPIDKAFYSNTILSDCPEFTNMLICKARYVKEIRDSGVYFRNGEVDDYNLSTMSTSSYSKLFSKVEEKLRGI